MACSFWRMALGLLMVTAIHPALCEPVLHLEVFKTQRLLRLYSGNTLLKTYPIALGLNPVPPKQHRGDNATPEGRYRISHKNPKSQFYLSLGISYPEVADAKAGLKAGIISPREYQAILRAHARHQPPPANTALGGDIFIHGHGASADWTWGCIALDDANMKELFERVPVGTPVMIHH